VRAPLFVRPVSAEFLFTAHVVGPGDEREPVGAAAIHRFDFEAPLGMLDEVPDLGNPPERAHDVAAEGLKRAVLIEVNVESLTQFVGPQQPVNTDSVTPTDDLHLRVVVLVDEVADDLLDEVLERFPRDFGPERLPARPPGR
jgi:hypothetical protein